MKRVRLLMSPVDQVTVSLLRTAAAAAGTERACILLLHILALLTRVANWEHVCAVRRALRSVKKYPVGLRGLDGRSMLVSGAE